MAKKKTKKKATKRAKEPHPHEEFSALESVLSRGMPPAVILKGAESWYRHAGAMAVLEKARERGDEVCRHDGKDPEFNLSRLLDDLTGGSLFAESRTVRLDRADALLKKGARGFSAGLVDALTKRLASGLPGCIVIGAESLRVDHAVVKGALAAGGTVVGCRRLWDTAPVWDPDPRRTELVQWLLARARERKIELRPDEAVYLARAMGNDLAALLDRLETLRDRGGKGVRELVEWEAGASPWDVAERMVEGDAARGAAGIEALFHGGFQGRDGTRTTDHAALVNLITSAITGKVRAAAAGASALATGAAPGKVVALAGVKGGPSVQKAFLEGLRRRTPAQWGRMLEEAANLERRSRTGATVDANDLMTLSLHWAKRAGR